jgi:PhzF family phenazine biosynthesis protein
MRLPIYQIDAFTDEVFRGNPAAICPLNNWPEDSILQSIAAENNPAETAFFTEVDRAGRYRLRWFTPTNEVALSGHATLASAYVIFRYLSPQLQAVVFDTASGDLMVTRSQDGFHAMDFPALPPERVPEEEARATLDGIADTLGVRPQELWRATYLMAVYEDEASIRDLRYSVRLAEVLEAIDVWGLIVTAPGETYDFVSRFFAPSRGIPEDPVTGSAHCTLAPYWARRTGRDSFSAYQVSARGGRVLCTVRGDRVELRGRCAPYLEGTLIV